MKKLLVLVGIAGIVLVLVLVGHRGRGGSVVEVDVQEAGKRAIRASILASGRVAHDEQVTLTSETIGIVSRVLVTEGQTVSKGDLVLEIRDDEYAATVDQQEALVSIQEAELERATLNYKRVSEQFQRNSKLFREKLISKDVFEKSVLDNDLAGVDLKHANASLAQAKAGLIQARNRLAKAKIYSPIDGVVVSLDIKEGETAIPSVGGIAGSTLMLIANPASRYVEVNVDEADIGNIQLGDEAEVVAVAYPSQPIKGVLYAMSNTAKVASGRQGLSFAVKIRPESPDGPELRSGMSCRTEIFSVSKSEVLAAPIKAIQVEEDRVSRVARHFVFVNEDNVAKKVEIGTGASDDTYQEVLRGLALGDSLIVGPDSALQHLKDGDPIQPKSEALSADASSTTRLTQDS